LCNYPGGSVYRASIAAFYIFPRWINRFQKGKTMTRNRLTHVIWDFPVMLFNKGREKIRERAAARSKEDARWLNG